MLEKLQTVSLQFIKLEFFMFRPAKLVMRNVSVFIFVFMHEDILDYVGMFLGWGVDLLAGLFGLFNYKIWDLQDKVTLLSNKIDAIPDKKKFAWIAHSNS